MGVCREQDMGIITPGEMKIKRVRVEVEMGIQAVSSKGFHKNKGVRRVHAVGTE